MGWMMPPANRFRRAAGSWNNMPESFNSCGWQCICLPRTRGKLDEFSPASRYVGAGLANCFPREGDCTRFFGSSHLHSWNVF
jgi:hypothetical protein